MPRLPAQIRPLIARQEGLIGRDQALAAGMTVAQIRTRLDRDDWVTIHPEVYRSTEHELSTSVWVRAASLWAGSGSSVSGHTAAWWWGLTDQPPGLIEVTVPRAGHRRSRPQARVVRRNLPPNDRAVHRGVHVTGLALSALDGAVALGPAGAAMLDRALQRRLQLADLEAAHQRNLGANGSPAAGRLLHAAADGAAAISERLLLRLLRRSGLSGWKVNARVSIGGHVIRPDIAFLDEGVAVEVDGWAWHHEPDRFQRDRVRQNLLVGAGWIVLRFTWFDLTQRPEEVIDQIENAVRRRRSDSVPSTW
ncbi:DUF559 domain-containing protein [Nakamurella sp. PAMC28650]|uniref:DUF559 domain-containing protein n=1 Tax=Nakamurella sp. PAMC28650 TaxID=2762325 RepID=UPI00164E5A94|nr:DUF559 domain-containing protein [Nakamurella sp. PAMC28650]QNK81395.1 DUF559 domain-containing protein [Nakamurella sp. PAMC28650]